MKITRIPRRLLPVLVGALLSLGASGASAAIDSLYAFGDSLSDAGNAYTLTLGMFPPPPYAQRASNGPVAIEQFAGRLGISSFAASSAGGTDYAVVGAETGTGNYAALAYGLPSLANTGIRTQVTSFAGSPPTFDAGTSLFFVWGGPNDIFTALATSSNVIDAANTAVQNLATDIGILASAGAKHFLVPNMPDLGLTPFGQSLGSAQAAGLSALSQGFNSGLSFALGALEGTYGLDIREFDTFSFMHDAVGNPSAFGFANVAAPCFDGVSVCSNPDEYLFWDDVHPTTYADRFLAEGFAAAVPEPATIYLLAAGLAGLALLRKMGTDPFFRRAK